jgi:dTDP-4-dehydrorhamnose 3,5-epimerase-like enzyme
MKNDSGLGGYKIIEIKQIASEEKGHLQFFEGGIDVPFEIKRIYYITDVKKGIWRGAHSHKTLKQLLFCPFGEILIKLTDGYVSRSVLLNEPNKGILIFKPLWRDILWNQDNSVLCVAASEHYDQNDYIRDFEEFLKFQLEK